jgi:hypothetical protein
MRLLTDDGFIEVYQTLLDSILDELMECVPRDVERRNNLTLQLHALQSIPERMNHWIEFARIAESKTKKDSDSTEDHTS